jgi:hypothetical protein
MDFHGKAELHRTDPGGTRGVATGTLAGMVRLFMELPGDTWENYKITQGAKTYGPSEIEAIAEDPDFPSA